jgi:hypothetical protein
MGVLHYENWDSVTAPAIPAGWNVQSAIVTATTPETPISSPNYLAFQGTDAAWHTATWGTADGNSGNVTVSGTVSFGGSAIVIGNSISFAVFCRSNSNATIYTGSTFYSAGMVRTGGTLFLDSIVGGTVTLLASVNLSTNFPHDSWVQLSLTANASALQVMCQRLTDGFWLNSAGNWQAGVATAISVIDSSITGSGYAGLGYLNSASGNDGYSDDWTLTGLTAPSVPPNHPIVVAFPFQYYPAWAD